MINYYEILGLKNNAEAFEIKAAFRKLAKLYHPDKNPQGKEHFAKLLKAYETLINPQSKLKYDYKLNYEESQAQNRASKAANKNNTFEERELKRRQYYNDHIKKYEKKKTHAAVVQEIPENYNEFKYILFATPLAVILFLLIVNLASNDRTYSNTQYSPMAKRSIVLSTNTTSNNFENSEQLLQFNLFGAEKYDYNSGAKLLIKNLSHNDIIICLFTAKKEFVRIDTISHSSSLELSNLPRTKLLIQYCNLLKPHDDTYSADLEKNLRFFKSKTFILPEAINPLTLLQETNKGFVAITKEEFFESIKK